MKIQIVDDDVELVKAVESTLSSVGHDVQFTNEPREGLKQIREQNHDLVFLDLSMPEFSGIDIIKNLAEDDTIKEKKIVVLLLSNGDLRVFWKRRRLKFCEFTYWKLWKFNTEAKKQVVETKKEVVESF